MAKKKSIMRSLGEFVGHVSKAVKTPVNAPAPARPEPAPSRPPVNAADSEEPRPSPAANPSQSSIPNSGEVRRTVEERTADTPHGRVVLRRTVIDEVVAPRDDQPAAKDRGQK